MFELRGLAKFSMVCRSFYWIAGRKQLLAKFIRRRDTVDVDISSLSKSLAAFKS
jgi:hypothetical protein